MDIPQIIFESFFRYLSALKADVLTGTHYQIHLLR